MDKAQIQKALADIKAQPPRKFTQSYDLVINLKNLELKSNPVDLFVTLPFPKGKSVKIAAFVDRELVEQATKFCI